MLRFLRYLSLDTSDYRHAALVGLDAQGSFHVLGIPDPTASSSAEPESIASLDSEVTESAPESVEDEVHLLGFSAEGELETCKALPWNLVKDATGMRSIFDQTLYPLLHEHGRFPCQGELSFEAAPMEPRHFEPLLSDYPVIGPFLDEAPAHEPGERCAPLGRMDVLRTNFKGTVRVPWTWMFKPTQVTKSDFSHRMFEAGQKMLESLQPLSNHDANLLLTRLGSRYKTHDGCGFQAVEGLYADRYTATTWLSKDVAVSVRERCYLLRHADGRRATDQTETVEILGRVNDTPDRVVELAWNKHPWIRQIGGLISAPGKQLFARRNYTGPNGSIDLVELEQDFTALARLTDRSKSPLDGLIPAPATAPAFKIRDRVSGEGPPPSRPR